MEKKIQIETGAQLLARLMRRPSLKGLEKVLFADGPLQNEVIELSGDTSAGKTLLTTQLLVKCLLPRRYKDFEINGLGAGAILVNTDHHFEIKMLVSLMTTFIGNVNNDEIVKDIIEDSLRYLTVVNCYDSAQFSLALQSLQTILSDDDKIALVAVDSISSYYWQDRESGVSSSMNGHLKRCLKLIQKYTFHHRVVLVYTRPSHFESKVKEASNCAAAPGEEQVNYRIQLHRFENKKKDNLLAVVESAVEKKNVGYSINDNGIQWITIKKNLHEKVRKSAVHKN